MKTGLFTKATNIAGGCRLLLLALLSLFVTVEGWATSTYYYTAKATATPTAGGKVYITNDDNKTPAATEYGGTKSFNGDAVGSADDGYANVDLYLFAKPEIGYEFDGWYDGNNRISTNLNYTATGKATGTWLLRPLFSPNRNTISYTAKFVKIVGRIQAYTTDIARGSVSISNPNNNYGDIVTITATPNFSQGIEFLGWRKNDTGEGGFVSTAKTYTLTVTTNETYYAYFSNPADVVYFRLKNKETGRYLSVYGNETATTHQTKSGKYTVNDGYTFTNSLKLIAEESAKGNPMTVFKRRNSGSSPITSDVKVENNVITTDLLIGDNGHPFTFVQQNDGTFRVYTTVYSEVEDYDVNLQCCLYDDNGDYVTTKAWELLTDDKEKARASWEVYYLTESQTEGAFGAYAKSKYTKDGYYYTTMYAPFPYKLLDGVTAYYLPYEEKSYNEEENVIKFEEILPGNIVPANKAVVLKCKNADDPTLNRLLPVTNADGAEPIPEKQLLNGYTQVWNNGSVNKEPNDETRYILSSKKGILGFYPYSEEYMNPNKAFLDLPCTLSELDQYLKDPSANAESLSKSVILSFGDEEEDEEPTGINILKTVVDDADAPLFDLQGRRVKHAKSGIFITNGKKIIK